MVVDDKSPEIVVFRENEERDVECVAEGRVLIAVFVNEVVDELRAEIHAMMRVVIPTVSFEEAAESADRRVAIRVDRNVRDDPESHQFPENETGSDAEDRGQRWSRGPAELELRAGASRQHVAGNKSILEPIDGQERIHVVVQVPCHGGDSEEVALTTSG